MKSIFIVGDSISIQYGPYLARFVDGRFLYNCKGGDAEARRNLDQPAGANGGDSGMVRDYLAACLADGKLQTDILLLNCGLHDIKTDPATGRCQVELADYEKNLRWIVERVGQAGIRLIWIRTTPVDETRHNSRQKAFSRYEKDQAAYNAAADRIMATASVPVVDLEQFTLRCGEPLFCDHVHFTAPVREKQAAFLAGYLDAMA